MWVWILTLIVFGHLQDGINSNPLSVADRGYVVTPGVGTHKIHTESLTWEAARRVCIGEGGDLAVVNSRTEAQVIGRLFTAAHGHLSHYNYDYHNFVLIGFNDRSVEGRYITVENEALVEAGYNAWGRGEPNDYSGSEDCGAIGHYGELNDISCDAASGFVCERPGWQKEAVGMHVTVARELIIEGREVSITCDVVGHPDSQVVWYKDDDFIQTNDRIQISGANKLIIPSAKKIDTGKYRCEPADGHMIGAHTVGIKVIVPVKVKIAINPGLFRTGSEISIACNADGYPTPTVQWYKDDNLIQKTARINITDNKLVIFTAEEKDVGKYRCEATNEYNSSAETVDIKVAMPVSVKIAINPGLFRTGSEISIACNADGYPTPTVQWYKDDNLIQKTARINITDNKLVIFTAEEKDVGKYRCEATNEYNSSAETVDIKVAMPVSVKIAINPGLFRTGSEISIACNADGYPTPTVQWYKDDNLIQKTARINITDNKLVISTAEKNDAGKYRCEAANEYTSSAETVDVRVTETSKSVPNAAGEYAHLGRFPKNLGDYSEEQGERFHQDLRIMEERYQGRWDEHMMADYCWSIHREDNKLLQHRRKSNKKSFFPIN